MINSDCKKEQQIDWFVSAITKIANHERVKRQVEPQVMQPLDIKEWQTKRILYAEGLFNQEMEKCVLMINAKL